MEDKKSQLEVDLEAHQENTRLNIKYSVDRFDILIISLSSGALALSTSFTKDVVAQICNCSLMPLKLSWLFYSLTIVLNLISQVTSYYANCTELKIVKDLLREKRGKERKIDHTKFERKKKIFDLMTFRLNAFCLISFILAAFLTLLFVFKKL